MKRIFSSLGCASLLLAGFINSSALSYASEGNSEYPTFYLKGSMNGWGNNADYTFSREKNVYSIHLDDLDGEFKISDAAWDIEFGARPEDDPVISSSRTVEGVKRGANYVARSLNDVNISFTFNPESPWTATISVAVNGVEPDRPEPEQWVSGTLPVLYINVYNEEGNYDNEVISKDLSHKNYFYGEYWLDLNGCEWLEAEGAASIGDKEHPLPLQIKARGNYTRKAFSKKPFKLKLDKKQSMLGLSKSKHFAILAHADDFFGYMRNFTGFNLGKRIGLPWTPWQQPVEVIINGDYRGLYFLTESIRVEADRVNIQELDDNVSDPSLISGGYLVELDNYDEENQIRMEEKGQAGGYKDMLRITFDTPEEYSDLQRMFVSDQFTAMNDAIGRNSDELWKYMDLDDAARYYIVEEILSHTESYHGSTYLFRDRGEGQKWHFSPLWDCGNAFMGPTNNYFTADAPFGNTWIASMRMNSTFMSKVKETWKWFMSRKYDGIYEDLDEYAARLQEAANADYRRWHGQPMPSFDSPQAVVDNRNMQQRLENVKSHLREKNEWLRREFGEYSDALYEEPERDMTEAAPLPEYVTTEVGAVSDLMRADEGIEIYNLQGMKVANLSNGEIYIVKMKDRIQKILAR